jgi:hypothetical protein
MPPKTRKTRPRTKRTPARPQTRQNAPKTPKDPPAASSLPLYLCETANTAPPNWKTHTLAHSMSRGTDGGCGVACACVRRGTCGAWRVRDMCTRGKCDTCGACVTCALVASVPLVARGACVARDTRGACATCGACATAAVVASVPLGTWGCLGGQCFAGNVSRAMFGRAMFRVSVACGAVLGASGRGSRHTTHKSKRAASAVHSSPLSPLRSHELRCRCVAGGVVFP